MNLTGSSLDGGSRRDQKAFTAQALFFFGNDRRHRLHDILGFGHTPLAHKAAGQLARRGLHDAHAVGAQTLQIALRGCMGIHVEVHGGSHGHGTPRREIGSKQQIVGHARRHLGEGVGRGGGYHVAIGPLAQRHVRVPLAVLGVEKLHQNGMFRQSGHRERRNELLGQRSHDHPHLGARAHQ